MELQNLEYFLKVAELGSVSKAAECFNISQPAMSKAIAQLEWEMDAPLFDRIGKRMFINERGKILVRSVRSSMKELEDGVSKVKSMASAPAGVVKIATYAATNIISGCLSAYSRVNPNVSFKMLGFRLREE